jgi:hypothetical protein
MSVIKGVAKKLRESVLLWVVDFSSTPQTAICVHHNSKTALSITNLKNFLQWLVVLWVCFLLMISS